MNKYESVVVINPELDEEKLKALQERITGIINKAGKVESVENMGKKKLAYAIKKHNEATFMLFKFEGKPELMRELERNYRIIDEILKFIIVK